MTDARLPERWLNDRRMLRLSDAAFRLYATALMWSVSNRTDGVVAEDDLTLMLRVDPGRALELEKHDLWQRDGDGWLISDFADTQTSKAQLDGLDLKRQQDRERAARYRDRRKSRDSSRDDKGQDRTGKDRHLEEGSHTNDEEHDDWPTPAIPGGGLPSDDQPMSPWAATLYDRE